MVDLHTHILPGFDDGAKTYEEARKLIEMEIRDGVEAIALTPHFVSGIMTAEDFLAKRRCAVEVFRDNLNMDGLEVNLLTGAEVLLSPEISEEKRLPELCYAGTSYLLVELPMCSYGRWITDVFYQISLKGITPILAHIERYPYLCSHVERLYDLVHAGVLTQVNADSVIHSGRFAGGNLSAVVKNNLLHFVASDTHSCRNRPPRMGEAMRIFRRKFGEKKAEYLEENSSAVLQNTELYLLEPVAVKKTLFRK